jgi:hypothetical protein
MSTERPYGGQAVKPVSCRRNRRAPSTRRLSLAIVVRLYEPAGKAASRGQRPGLRLRPAAEEPAPGADDDGTVEMVTSSITSSSRPCRIATPPSRCTRRTPYLLRSTLQTTSATLAASKAAERTRSYRRDLRAQYLTKHQPKSRMRENRASGSERSASRPRRTAAGDRQHFRRDRCIAV